MTPEQLAELLKVLSAGKVADDRLNPERVFLRGWNEGVAFAENKIRLILGEPK